MWGELPGLAHPQDRVCRRARHHDHAILSKYAAIDPTLLVIWTLFSGTEYCLQRATCATRSGGCYHYHVLVPAGSNCETLTRQINTMADSHRPGIQ
ncbi:hypothetical protein IF1G_10675 [Cordyceps javanica]|uniref:Uncharacterized protein n=1 Tax=Cordyceps javanica TaxID=43265 RepID=A0A545UMP5_9HYPO|nr:hypothetical protein IF1G_10675 [Cordyceps javanica]